MKKKSLRLALIVILSAVAIYCIVRITTYLNDGYQNAQLISSLRQPIVAQAEITQNGSTGQQIQQSDPAKAQYESLLAACPDAIGWISIPSTDIDYPVVQARDNEYYLTHNYKKQESSHGSIFLDYRNGTDANGQLSVIYGHNMKDGSMFGHLPLYQDKSYFLVHPQISLNLRGVSTQWTVFAAVHSGDEAFQIDFASPTDFSGYIHSVVSKSIYSTEITPSASDCLLALSTCSHDFDGGRFVVYAKKS